MRKIIYRGLRTDGKGWVYGDLSQDYIHHKGFTIVEGGCIYNEVIPESVGICLNKKDISGVDIYEGDIIRARAVDVIHPQDLHKIKEEYVESSVYWDDNMCCFETDFNAYWFPDSDRIFEVIGNIHE